MDHIQNRPMDERSIVARENVSSLPNDQICDWCRRHCGQCIGPLSAIAGPFYLNPEANVGAEDGVTGATVDLHIGAKGDGFGQTAP